MKIVTNKTLLKIISINFYLMGMIFVLTACSSERVKPNITEVPKVETTEVQPQVKTDSEPAKESQDNEEPIVKYSNLNNLPPPSDRNYKRMTRQKMEDDSELYGSAGSLWKMEGQTSYLFAENKHRQEGDPTSIKMEGQALKLIESKVVVIQDLLKQLDEQRKKAEEESKKAEQEKMRLAQIEEEKKLRAERIARGEKVDDSFSQDPELQALEEAQRKIASTSNATNPDSNANAKTEKEETVDLKEIDLIPSKIVEKLADGIYRIRGQQFLTIKKKPYKVIATALIRAEDFSDANVSSTKLLDAQYDVIHLKRTNQ